MPALAPSKRPATGGSLGALWRAVVAALAAGLFGTGIQASLFYAGDTPIIWGVGLAWLLLGLLVYWAVVASGKMWAGAVAFIGCYVTVGVISYVGNDQMLLSAGYFKFLPGPTLASLLWMYGMVIPAVIALMSALRVLRKANRKA
ncbi:hypothetical protein DFO58_0443 [Arthrobacter sp. AG1021]|uniref:hypothetical protein n=1 Tax=Arthrobacter sp. AG1021 TaxID=2183908 RepID=UPI000EB02329|nr:hypothetical protein [Arthrobacter sp. AG1021]RKS22415.1 hypothetical protein DFO58_0443 [Arthrobacter sp. AG1021]